GEAVTQLPRTPSPGDLPTNKVVGVRVRRSLRVSLVWLHAFRGGLLLELAIEEIGGSFVAGEPVAMEQEIVNFVGEDELLDFDVALGPEAGDKIDGLREVDVAIVVAVNEEHRGLPSVDRSDRRGLVCELGKFGRDVL